MGSKGDMGRDSTLRRGFLSGGARCCICTNRAGVIYYKRNKAPPRRVCPVSAGVCRYMPPMKGEVAQMKLLVKLLAVIAALSAAAAVIALLLAEEQRGEYISIYDHDEDEIPF